MEMMNPSLVIPFEYVNIQVTPHSSVTEVHMMFIMLHLTTVYVSVNGRLCGVITRNLLKYEVSKRRAGWAQKLKTLFNRLIRKPFFYKVYN